MVKVLLSLLVTTTLVVSVRGLAGQPLQTQAGDGPEAAAAPKVHAAARCTRSKVAGLLKSCFRTNEKGKRCLFDPAKDEARKHMLIREMCLCIVAEPGMQDCIGECIVPLFEGNPDTEALCYLFKRKPLNHGTVFLEEEADCEVPTLTPTQARAAGVETSTGQASPAKKDVVLNPTNDDTTITASTAPSNSTGASSRTWSEQGRCLAKEGMAGEWDLKEAELAMNACMAANEFEEARACLAAGFADCVCMHADDHENGGGAASLRACVGSSCWAAWWGARLPRNRPHDQAAARTMRNIMRGNNTGVECRHRRLQPNASSNINVAGNSDGGGDEAAATPAGSSGASAGGGVDMQVTF
eukprot:gene22055-6843_t